MAEVVFEFIYKNTLKINFDIDIYPDYYPDYKLESLLSQQIDMLIRKHLNIGIEINWIDSKEVQIHNVKDVENTEILIIDITKAIDGEI